MKAPIVFITKSSCILCGICEALAPHIFKQETMSIDINQAEATRCSGETLLCVEACPTNAIELKR